MSFPSRLPETAIRLLPYLARSTPVWLVGGGVRDHLLGRKTVDLDFAVDGDARSLARHLADCLGGHYYDLDKERDTGRVIMEGGRGKLCTLDFARLRGPDIIADLQARDFTINAIAVSMKDPEEWLDPTGGVQDLKQKVLRTCSPSAVSDDPVRALRAVRLAQELGLQMVSETLHQVQQDGAGLTQVSPERVRDEILRILDARRPGLAIRLMGKLNLLLIVFPELADLKGFNQPPPHAYNAMEHTLAVADMLGDLLMALESGHEADVAADLILAHAALRLGCFRKELNAHLDRNLSHGRSVRQLLFFAALFCDAGKPDTQQSGTNGRMRFQGYENIGAGLVEARAVALRMSNSEVHHLGQIVRHHTRPMILERSQPITWRAIYRFFRQARESGVEAVLLSLADLLGTYATPVLQDAWESRVEVARTLFEAYFHTREERIEPPPLLRGNELVQTLGLAPGPEIGRLLEVIREAQAAGEVSTLAQALALARSTTTTDVND